MSAVVHSWTARIPVERTAVDEPQWLLRLCQTVVNAQFAQIIFCVIVGGRVGRRHRQQVFAVHFQFV